MSEVPFPKQETNQQNLPLHQRQQIKKIKPVSIDRDYQSAPIKYSASSELRSCVKVEVDVLGSRP